MESSRSSQRRLAPAHPELLLRLLGAIGTGVFLAGAWSCGGDATSNEPTTTSSGGTGGGQAASGGTGGTVSSSGGSGGNASGGTSTGGSIGSGGSGGTSLTGGAGGATTMTCAFGTLTEFCLTPEQMESQAHYGVGEQFPEKTRSDEEIAAGWDENGCIRHDWIATGCCNPALAPGVPNGEECCYVACEGDCCGRPLVVAGSAQTAKVTARDDWAAFDVASTTTLDPAQAEQLAQAWLEDGLMEHAAIAAFARFSLQLLHLGAPAELVRAAQQAGLDEVEHAKHCFSIAGRLAGGECSGPGPLPAATSALMTRLENVVAAAIHEGCIGETLSAAVAREQALRAADPDTRSRLEAIAEDEARHAELAWSFVAWALRGASPGLLAAAERALEAALDSAPVASAVPDLPEPTLNAWGRLSRTQHERLVAKTLRDVLRPAAAALLGQARGERAETRSATPRPASASIRAGGSLS